MFARIAEKQTLLGICIFYNDSNNMLNDPGILYDWTFTKVIRPSRQSLLFIVWELHSKDQANCFH